MGSLLLGVMLAQAEGQEAVQDCTGETKSLNLKRVVASVFSGMHQGKSIVSPVEGWFHLCGGKARKGALGTVLCYLMENGWRVSPP